MKLELHERIALLQLLPQQGSYAELKAIRKAREIFSINQEEKEFFEIVEDPPGSFRWNAAKASQKVMDAPIEQYIMEIVRKKLADMEHNHKLTNDYISLYEKFVIAYRTVEP